MTSTPESSRQRQVFAAAGSGRIRALRTALAIGGLLLAIWLAALALGVFGGFAALPVLDLGGEGADQAAVSDAPSSETTGSEQSGAAGSEQSGAAGSEQSGAADGGGEQSGADDSPSGQQPASATIISPAQGGNGQSAIAPHGKPAGSGTGTGSGKPIGTPGNGGTNGGGTGNGKALGHAK